VRAVGALLSTIAAAACIAPAAGEQAGAPATAPPASLASPTPTGPEAFVYEGELTQGGWIRGQAPAGTVQARLDGQALTLDAEGRFFAAFDRDAGPTATLTAILFDRRSSDTTLTISPRAWQIEQIDADFHAGVSDAEFTRRREPELARIAAARAVETGSEGWRQGFIWPVRARISGRFGSQRVYRGKPGSYHSGLDLAGGAGTTYVAPADGVVVLAAAEPFTLEGHLLIIDHGMGLNSAFLHSSELLVREGDVVRQGQPIGRIGATGRVTGPHLHWSLMWRGLRLDPLLFTPPMD
jgi:murein DD-endopeptidase MepM/ murein hydrolase activator NlpD